MDCAALAALWESSGGQRSHPTYAEARLRTAMPNPKRRQSRRTPNAGAESGAPRRTWSGALPVAAIGFGGPPKPTGRRPVLPVTVAPKAKLVRSTASGTGTAFGLCSRLEFGLFWALEFVSDFGFGAADLASRGSVKLGKFCRCSPQLFTCPDAAPGCNVWRGTRM